MKLLVGISLNLRKVCGISASSKGSVKGAQGAGATSWCEIKCHVDRHR